MSNYSNLYIDTAYRDYGKENKDPYNYFIHPQSVHGSSKYRSIPLSSNPKISSGSFSSRNSYSSNQHPSNSSHFSNYSNNNYLKNESKHSPKEQSDTKYSFDSAKQKVKINNPVSTININGINLSSSNLPNNNSTTPVLVDINDLIGKEKKPITIDYLNIPVENFEQSKYSSKSMGIIHAYGANTHPGLVRNYNEDRVSIIINMNKPQNYKSSLWPKVSFFGIYDGHGGYTCAEYLRDNLHKFIVQDKNFPDNIPQAIKNGFELAEKDFITNHALSKHNDNVLDRSGSCGVVVMIVDSKIYVANVGDSRAVMSAKNGETFREITTDHKPDNPKEKSRIIDNGGKVYQSQTPIPNFGNQILIGPYRVLPGRLSVSRTVGDVEAKKTKFGGLPNVIIAEPEIFVLDLEKEDLDFIVMGCDGIFDQMSNKDVVDCVWMIFKQQASANTIHAKCGKAVDLIIKSAMMRKSFDNVTCLLVAFKDIKSLLSQNAKKNNTVNSKIVAKSTSFKEYKGNYELSKMTNNNQKNNSSMNNNSNNSNNNTYQPSSNYTSNIKITKSYNTLSNKNTFVHQQDQGAKVSSSPNKIKYQISSTPRYVKYAKDPNPQISYNTFLTPTNKKLSKDVNQMRKKKDLILNTNSSIYNHFGSGIIEHRCNTVKSDRFVSYENERHYNGGMYHSNLNTGRGYSQGRHSNMVSHSTTNSNRNNSAMKYTGLPFKYNTNY